MKIKPTSLQKNELSALIQVSKTINAHLEPDQVLASVMSVTTNIMQVEASSLILIEQETNDLLFHIACGEKANIIKPMRMKQGQGIVGWVIDNKEPLIVNNVAGDPGFRELVARELLQ